MPNLFENLMSYFKAEVEGELGTAKTECGEGGDWLEFWEFIFRDNNTHDPCHKNWWEPYFKLTELTIENINELLVVQADYAEDSRAITVEELLYHYALYLTSDDGIFRRIYDAEWEGRRPSDVAEWDLDS